MLKIKLLFLISLVLLSLPKLVLSQSNEDKNKQSIGSQRGEEKQEQKKVLILAPYLWDFAMADESPWVAALFKKKRWYKGNVTYRRNTNKLARSVSIADFANWANYDIIHVSTHGIVHCDEKLAGGCPTIIQTGYMMKESEWKDKQQQLEKKMGLPLTVIKNDKGLYEIALTTQSFKKLYAPGSLDNKIIFFSACEVALQSDLIGYLKNNNKNIHIYAWDKSVDASVAQASSKTFYEELMEKGKDTHQAYKAIKQLAIHEFTNGKLLHGIENITLHHPETNEILTPNTVYPFKGQTDDGKEDEIEVAFEITGYPRSEIEKQGLRFSLLIDGKTVVKPMPLSTNSNPNITWTSKNKTKHLVTIKKLKIPDLKADKKTKWRAKLELPKKSGDHTIHTVKPILFGGGDVKLTLSGPSGTAVLIYDQDKDITRMRSKATGDNFDLYFDYKNRWVYVPDQSGGWVKIKMGAPSPNATARVIAILYFPTKKHRVPYALKELIDTVYRSPNEWLKPHTTLKQKVSCPSGKCQEYHYKYEKKTGVARYDSKGRFAMIKNNDDEYQIEAQWGSYDHQLPAARQINLPKNMPIPLPF